MASGGRGASPSAFFPIHDLRGGGKRGRGVGGGGDAVLRRAFSLSRSRPPPPTPNGRTTTKMISQACPPNIHTHTHNRPRMSRTHSLSPIFTSLFANSTGAPVFVAAAQQMGVGTQSSGVLPTATITATAATAAGFVAVLALVIITVRGLATTFLVASAFSTAVAAVALALGAVPR